MIRLFWIATWMGLLVSAPFPSHSADGQCVSEALAAQSAYTAVSSCVANSSADSSSSSAPAQAASGITYSLESVCERGSGEGAPGFYGCGGQSRCGTNGDEYWVWEHAPGGSRIVGITCVEAGEAAPAEVLTPGRISEAFKRIPVPTPQVGVNPVGGRTLVNFDTIFHTQAESFTTTVTLLRRQVTFDITPSEFTWRTGQGDFTTTEPGREYRASLPMSAYVTYRYLRAGRVDLGLDTTWTARWRVGSGPWQPVNGTVTTSSPSVPLEVVTARPQLVSYD